ncbi:MAG: cytochrome bc1 complex Rieske iron-sulfur subunit [Candidatus Nanopelagicales bacterium]
MTPSPQHPSRPQAAPVAHQWRATDLDAAAARRAERQVAGLFATSALLIVISVLVYGFVDWNTSIGLPVVGDVNAINFFMGLSFGLGVLCIGLGAIHWAKQLMSDIEVVEDRHDFPSEPQDRDQLAETFAAGVAESRFVSSGIMRRSLLGAMALFPIPLVVLLRDLGPSPSNGALTHTIWTAGTRLVTDVTYLPIKGDEVPIGGLINAVPETLRAIEEREGSLNARAKAVIVVVRIDERNIVAQQGGSASAPWDYKGVLAYSKVCTHVGCPISLYEQRTHHLLCPCHQSTFDLADAGKVVFGPAARNMPQLPITTDAEGYLIARSDFQVPVGPSFWERT